MNELSICIEGYCQILSHKKEALLCNKTSLTGNL